MFPWLRHPGPSGTLEYLLVLVNFMKLINQLRSEVLGAERCVSTPLFPDGIPSWRLHGHCSKTVCDGVEPSAPLAGALTRYCGADRLHLSVHLGPGLGPGSLLEINGYKLEVSVSSLGDYMLTLYLATLTQLIHSLPCSKWDLVRL